MRAIEATYRNLALRFLILSVICVSPVKADSHKAESPDADHLIAEANVISRDFTPEERANLLLDILDTPLGTSPTQGEKWSLELFSISKNQLRPGSYRAATQKNALVALAKIDSSEAAKLFKSQDTPDMWNEPVPAEDYRTWAARTLFPRLWAKSGMRSLPEIRELSSWLGLTGEYPYVAMIPIVLAVAKIDKGAADGLIAAAIGFYRTDLPFLNKYREFTPFILGIAEAVRPSLVSRAIQAELDELDADKKDAEANQVKYVFQVTNSRRTVQFSQQSEYVLYQLLPVVNRLDPNWANELADKYEVLKYLDRTPDAGATRVAGVAIMPDGPSSSADVALTMDEHRLLQVTMLADGDPEQAAEIAMDIRDPGRRAVAEATLVPAFDKLDPRKSADWQEEATREVDRLPPGKTRLRLLVAMAKAELVEGRFEAALPLFNKAFDLGQLLFTQDLNDNPGKMAYAADGEEELKDLVTAFAQKSKLFAIISEQVRGLHNDLLKAKLLVAAAKGSLSQPKQAALVSH